MSYSLPWNKAVWTEQSDCRISWGDGNCDTALPAWSKDIMGPGGIFFRVIFPCAVALLFLRSTGNHWLAVSGVRQKTSTCRSSVPSEVSHSAQISCCNRGPLLKSSYPFLPWPLVSAASLREDPQTCNGECDWFANLLNSWWQLAWIKHTWHICSTLFLSCDSFQFWSQRKNLAVLAWQKSNLSCVGHACTNPGCLLDYEGLDS